MLAALRRPQARSVLRRAEGGEVLGVLVVAIHGQVPIARLKTMISAYPTCHRAIEDALRNLDAG